MASRTVSPENPKASLPFSEPAMDWKIMSAGAPCFTASIWVVMWDRTQICVGISNVFFTSSKSSRMAFVPATVSLTGFRPMTASPQP